jgi:hypothetical protein
MGIDELHHIYRTRRTARSPEGALYRLEGYDLFRSVNDGKSWNRLGTLPARGYPVWGTSLACGAEGVLFFVHVGTGKGKKAVYISMSSDEGATWTNPSTVNDEDWAQRTDPTVVARGSDVFVAWEERSQRGPAGGERPGGIYVTHSENGGLDWGQDIWMREGEDCWISVGDDGTVYLTYIGGERHDILYVSYSEDNGTTWRSVATKEIRMVINEPCVVAAAGKLHIFFRGARPTFAHLSPGTKLDYQVYCIMSEDKGSTWSSITEVGKKGDG